MTDDATYAFKSLVLPMMDEIWRHYKGGLYIVTAIGVDENGRPVVIYISAQQMGPLFVQPLGRFVEMLDIEGERPGEMIKTPRFVFVNKGA